MYYPEKRHWSRKAALDLGGGGAQPALLSSTAGTPESQETFPKQVPCLPHKINQCMLCSRPTSGKNHAALQTRKLDSAPLQIAVSLITGAALPWLDICKFNLRWSMSVRDTYQTQELKPIAIQQTVLGI
jgi:hypothetical protein